MDTFSDKNLQLDSRFKARLKTKLLKKEAALTGRQPKKPALRLWPIAATAAAALVLVAACTAIQLPGGAKITLSQVVVAAQNRQNNVDDAYNFAQLEKHSRNTGLAYCENPLPGQKRQHTNEKYSYNNGKTMFGMEIPYEGADISMWYEDNIDKLPQGASVPLKISQMRNSTGLGLSPLDLLRSGQGDYVDKSGQPISSEAELAPITFNDRNVYQLFTTAPAEHFPHPANDNCGGIEVVQEILIDAETFDIAARRLYRNTATAPNLVETTVYQNRYANISQDEALSIMEQAGFVLDEARKFSKN
jgi:hypothetical protein